MNYASIAGSWNNYNTNRLKGNNDIVHDLSGHLLEVGPYVGGNPRFEMEYDALGMQTRFISRQTGAEADYRYLYGPGDRRLVTFDTTTGERVFKLRGLGDEVLREYSVTGWGSAGGGNTGEGWVHQKDLLYGPEGAFATRNRTGSEVRFLHKDHLGTPRLLTNHLGTTVGRHDYYPFGLEAPRSGQADEPTKKYTGHERDPHGLADYMLGRTYLYPFMRFATPDPARDGWSLYAYTGNNPVNRVDPDGHVTVILIVSPSSEELKSSFGHAASITTFEDQRDSLSRGTPTQLEPAVSDFINEYLDSGQTVNAYVLNEDPARDQALIEEIKKYKKTVNYEERRENCSTSCGEILRGAGVLEEDQRPERGLLFDSPGRLQESLETGSLSQHVESIVVFDPRRVQSVIPSQIMEHLGIEDRPPQN